MIERNYSDDPSAFKLAWLSENNPKSLTIDFPNFKSKVIPEGNENPSELHWYEHNDKKKKFILSEDTTVDQTKSYFNISQFSYTDEQIEDGSFSLKKSIQNGGNLDFMGCIATKLEFKVANDFKYLNDQDIVAILSVIDLKNDIKWNIKVFTGLVDTVSRDKSRDLVRNISANDYMYRLIDEYEVTDWYVWQYGDSEEETSLTHSVYELRNTFWDYICNSGTEHSPNGTEIQKKGEGWTQVTGASLINDNIQIPKTLNVSPVEYDPYIGSERIGGPWLKPVDTSYIIYEIPNGIMEGWNVSDIVARKDVIQMGLAYTAFTYTTVDGLPKTETNYREYLDDCDNAGHGIAATIKVKKELEQVRETQITALTVLQSICQYNACFGQFNGDGQFEYIQLDLSNPFEIEDQYQINVGYSDIEMPKITGVVIFDKTSEEYTNDEIHTEYGSVKNVKKGSALAYWPTNDLTKVEGDDAHVFTMDDNFLMNSFDQSHAIDVAHNIYDQVANLTMRNSNLEIKAMPWLQCGQAILYHAPTNRTLYPTPDLYPNSHLYPSGYEAITSVVMSYEISGTGLFKGKIECKVDELTSDIANLNEIISAEMFYRKIGDSQTYSSIKQTKDEIDLVVKDTNRKYSEIQQTVDRITLRVVDLDAQTSGIQTEIIMTKNEIGIHAQTIELLSHNLQITSDEVHVQAHTIEVMSDSVEFLTTNGVTFTDLSNPNSKTVINGGHIKTGEIDGKYIKSKSISCDRITLGSITVGQKTYDVDWIEYDAMTWNAWNTGGPRADYCYGFCPNGSFTTYSVQGSDGSTVTFTLPTSWKAGAFCLTTFPDIPDNALVLPRNDASSGNQVKHYKGVFLGHTDLVNN